jgi:hypothetical protein
LGLPLDCCDICGIDRVGTDRVFWHSFTARERKLLKSSSINIVSHCWIEDALGSNSHPYPPESDYDLRFVLPCVTLL